MGQQLSNERQVPIGAVHRRRARITIYAERVHYPVDTDVALERIVRCEVYIDAEITAPHTDSVVYRRGVGRVRVARYFDLPYQSVQDLGRLNVGVAVYRMALDRRLVHTGVINDLPNKSRHTVDRQAWTAVALTLALDLVRPLDSHAAKLKVFPRLFPILRFRFLANLEGFADFNEFIVGLFIRIRCHYFFFFFFRLTGRR